jgi:hypothetical protein
VLPAPAVPTQPDAAPFVDATEAAPSSTQDLDAGDAGEAEAGFTSACNEQEPQDWLIRTTYFPPTPAKDLDETRRRVAGHQRSVEYRTRQYGYYPGFGRRDMNPHSPSHYVKSIKWFGLPVMVHEKIVPALACVEEEIRRTCADKPYTPRALGGIRMKNTYHTGEVTNHAYGIAMDIDPAINTCCGCVPPWNKHPRCGKKVVSPFERMEMPECWVHAFTRYGFYWLGYDPMQDTMHYEFLGDPDRIVRR